MHIYVRDISIRRNNVKEVPKGLGLLVDRFGAFCSRIAADLNSQVQQRDDDSSCTEKFPDGSDRFPVHSNLIRPMDRCSAACADLAQPLARL